MSVGDLVWMDCVSYMTQAVDSAFEANYDALRGTAWSPRHINDPLGTHQG